MSIIINNRRFLSVTISALILGLFCAFASTRPAQAAPPPAGIPPGFNLVLEEPGVRLYKKVYANGNPDYVQVVDLSQGARVQVMHGEVTNPGEGRGIFGGNNARFLAQTLQKYWSQLARSGGGNPVCVTNGQFFYMPESPTRLPFPLKKDGTILTDGYGDAHFAGKQLMLELWPGRADITTLTQEALQSSTAPDIIAGLAEDAPKRIKFSVGRTFTAVGDLNGDGAFETVFIFNSLSSKQNEAADVLRSFGGGKVMMLDGGGSTQLICNNKWFVKSERFIPQAIGVLAAAGQNQQASQSPALSAPDAALEEIPVDDNAAPSAVDDMNMQASPPTEEAAAPASDVLTPIATLDSAQAAAAVDLTPPPAPAGEQPLAQEALAAEPSATALTQEQPSGQTAAPPQGQAQQPPAQDVPADPAQVQPQQPPVQQAPAPEAPASSLPQEQPAQEAPAGPAQAQPSLPAPQEAQALPQEQPAQEPPAVALAAVLSSDAGLAAPEALSAETPATEGPIQQAALTVPAGSAGAPTSSGVDNLLLVPAAILPLATFFLMTILRTRRQV